MVTKSTGKYINVFVFFIVTFVLSFMTSTSKYYLSFELFGVISLISFILICFIIAPKVIFNLKNYIENTRFILVLVIIIGFLAIKLGEYSFYFYLIFFT